MGEKKKLQEAKRLGEQGQFQQAWELLFGKAKAAPELELVEGDGRKMTLEEWKRYWLKHGCEIAGLRHFYALADYLTPEQLAAIRKDCHESWIVCDRLDYQGSKVSINGGCFVECPEYEGALLAEVLGTPAGRKLFHELCRTEDGADAILQKFVKLSGMMRGDIRVWTLSMDSRKACPSRAAGFYYGSGGFHVSGNDFLGNYGLSGRSRGVRRRREAR